MITATIAFLLGIYTGWNYIKQPSWMPVIDMTKIVAFTSTVAALFKRLFTKAQ